MKTECPNKRKALREHRLDKFWSQAELAKQAGIGADTVNRLENGKQNPSFITIRKLAKALEVKPEEIEF
ncbi:MAG: helix-turn-helix transcriptional regulator [Dehalococcoides mccartyi]|uniref:Helix-turn-helix transcriptional regulator n=1 Tax=Dehalococcoides mccartyi TaxID=61435 RepID=A0AB38ZBY9_9CHLR|nr:helix-turn-helix transcriptional regulator [Dehalococcoides mccartyi]MDN4185460.1 helix-turn-helix transcriptional regulator [Dehalococcoides mccartyi]MDP4279320.1 helix-turn-helix transcriptional regulator [Dehalococcoides mccartyi]WRO08063.1 helix-turn-helix transcriptional regulator [Dehalococcoides mccartyi]